MDYSPYDTARQNQEQAARRLRQRQARKAKAQGKASHPFRLETGSDTQRCGHAVEQRARELLQACGLRILAANLHCRAGEIDVVARDANTLVFVEVRHRSDPRFGGAAASVNRPKQARLIRAARFFLPALTRHYFAGNTPACRFDVVAEDGNDMRWIRNAFDAEAG